jgi:hypothetical protein
LLRQGLIPLKRVSRRINAEPRHYFLNDDSERKRVICGMDAAGVRSDRPICCVSFCTRLENRFNVASKSGLDLRYCRVDFLFGGDEGD